MTADSCVLATALDANAGEFDVVRKGGRGGDAVTEAAGNGAARRFGSSPGGTNCFSGAGMTSGMEQYSAQARSATPFTPA